MTKADEEREAVLDDLVGRSGDFGRRGQRALVIDPRFPSTPGADHQQSGSEETSDTVAEEGDGEPTDEPIADEELAGDDVVEGSTEDEDSAGEENERSEDEGS